MSGVISAVAGLIDPGLGAFVDSLANGGQSFATTPLSNSRLALYTLSINSPDSPYSSVMSYTFPLTPSSLVKTSNAMTNVFDVANPNAAGGIERVADLYGNSPVMFRIEGTTGWQLHSADNYQYTGLESIIQLQKLLQEFANLNAQQTVNSLPPYTMEFFDYFQNDFWQVVPVGPQEIRQSRQRPLYVEYAFRFAGIVSVAEPLSALLADPILSILQNPKATAISTLSQVGGSFLNGYLNQTPGAFSLPGIVGSAVNAIDSVSNFIGDFGGGSSAQVGAGNPDNVSFDDVIGDF